MKNMEVYYIKFSKLFIIFMLLIKLVIAYKDLHLDFPGPYCAQRGAAGCCENRKDSCAVPIQGTLCYCDDFCDRGHSGDCCPDYDTYCKNVPPPVPTQRCFHNGIYINHGQSLEDNCNHCTCRNGIMECENDICIQDNDIINNINLIDESLKWHAKNYSEFWGRKYSEGIKLRLGTFEPSFRVKSQTRLSNRITNIPVEFNALNQWSGLLTENIKDQGWCGSSWVISTTSVASDRFAIQSKGQEVVDLSAQNILSCTRRQQGCLGGHLDAAWRYLHMKGVVNEECFPYEAHSSHCRTYGIKSLRQMGCHSSGKVDRDHFYSTGPAYSLNNETDIQIEIMRSGPVQATMRIYRDFFSYGGGIYRRSAANRDHDHGFHSVKLIGWGEERHAYQTTKYWIAANSWGTWWGEKGYFRVLRGVNECMIEDYVLASWPHVFNPHVKRVSPYKK
ncbi:uncharacterized peptidase C1-like protein F26E4.3 [Condylostylus longicornis]|uniref:uncharacterized peptidase C1-like protein F26E4.3 n=1 Tax=Condylostylus longicornis TaxID=2530218 RepID=UPI00244E0414|nr:uncharacterized peptidase C1-like protein F26E4.3 [Condylostylus longicornis]XP_055379804.1 uncharacterized peptidase C1-like protein F26E4.3 [Condylostylus longicornis]XP_055379805.1 uncharacterized peptidase C1-like protein F26E4.3 [Condylostylus longicornis]XP_055379806.1 uncharacterized peptidase C1-like protein F26E4.3 [Condylostylus longicornis]XP_055379807.1 uncharacterized peptidase C1-like protein F26E4.3 [Condylostylus longicornis]XP_055379808.1 uncharacterized peptidase C1-like p